MNKTEVSDSIKWMQANKGRTIERPQDAILKMQVEKIKAMSLPKLPKIGISPDIYESYRARVLRYTNTQDIVVTQNGSEKMNLDHKISIRTCYLKKVSEQDAGHLTNLRVIPATWNNKKRRHNYIDDENRWILEKYGIDENSLVCVTENGCFI